MVSLTSSSLCTKRRIVLEEENKEAWTIYPTPGMVVKFRDVTYVNKPKSTLLDSSIKFFVNIAHCAELPGPAEDLEEDDVAKLISANRNGFKIPISISDLDSVEDKRGENATKVDVLVNSTFFNKRLKTSEFFCQLTLAIICEAVEKRHGICVDLSKQVILRNRKCVGELNSQQIRKKPKCSFNTAEEDHIMEDNMQNETLQNDYEDILNNGSKRPRNFRVQVIGGVFADIRVRVRDQAGNLVNDVNRISLKMNDDRCVVLLDQMRTVADFFLPFRLSYDLASCEFESESGSLIVKCPIDWN